MYLENDKPNQVLKATKGDDYIVNGGGIVTINAYDGKNFIENTGSLVKIFSGKENDTIDNTGNDVNMSVGGGDDSVKNEGGNVNIYSDSGNNEIRNYGGNVKIFTGSGNDNIYNSHDNVTISSGSGNDNILMGYAKKLSISCGAGNDTIENQSQSNDDSTITGGKGDDVIYINYASDRVVINYTYGDGNDTIGEFDSDDILYITTSKSFSTTKSGSNMYFIFDNGSITLKNVGEGVGSSNFIIQGNELPTGLNYNDDKTEITASKKFKGSAINLTKYPKVKNLNASAVTKKLKITGNSLDNEIQGSTKNDTILGGAGNDTIIGSAGNDVLTGGKGNDVFVYSRGNDVIKDYTAGADIIKLQDATIKSWKTSGKNIIFTTTKGKITVKNGKSKAITITETKIYSNSSSNVSELFEENNFATADNLSEIVKNNLTPTSLEKIDTNNFENLTQENNLITYSEK